MLLKVCRILRVIATVQRRVGLFRLVRSVSVLEVVAALAERVVRKASRAHVLTTSRDALRAEGDHVHLLQALDDPP
jgi:predicted ATPase